MTTPTEVPKEAQPMLFTFSPKGVTKSYDYTYCDHYLDYFKTWKTVMIDFEINPELNCAGNLHYHGYYILNEKMRYRWFHKILPKMKYNGMVRIEAVKCDLTKAMEYARKDRQLMSKLIKFDVPLTKARVCGKDFDLTFVLNTESQTINSYLDENCDSENEAINDLINAITTSDPVIIQI